MKTLMYDPETRGWTDMNPGTSPPYRGTKYGMAYDSFNDAVILVGGQLEWGGTPFSDIWAYDVKTNNWRNMNPVPVGGSLPGNSTMMTAYDSRHNVILTVTNDGASVWAYKYKHSGTARERRALGQKPPVFSVIPNPFSDRVLFSVGREALAGAASGMSLNIYDLQGRLVHSIDVNAADAKNGMSWDAGKTPAGVYTAVFRKGDFSLVRKCLLTK
jgi:hypothetical protein